VKIFTIFSLYTLVISIVLKHFI